MKTSHEFPADYSPSPGTSRSAEVPSEWAGWRFDAVLHFAALSIVGASMREPLHYIAENVAHSLRLADAAIKAGCLRFVLSSTAALFGDPDRVPIDELEGRITSTLLTPYPPGIPLLIPGERFNATIVRYL